MGRGLTLEDVIHDRKTKKCSFESSQLFWFSVLRKIYIHSRDPLREQSREDYLSLQHYLEEKLAKDSEQLEKLIRTITLFLATDHGDSNTVESLVMKIAKSDFFTYLLTPPGLLFPSWVLWRLSHQSNACGGGSEETGCQSVESPVQQSLGKSTRTQRIFPKQVGQPPPNNFFYNSEIIFLSI